MERYDEQLKQLQEDMARCRKLEAMADSLRRERARLAEEENQLSLRRAEEQGDVDRLEGRTLAAFFYAVTGRRGEKLDQERQEAYAAAVKHDAAVHQLRAVEEDLARTVAELEPLRDCESRYRQVLAEKAEAVKAAGTPEAAKILDLEDQLASEASCLKEIQEAITAGSRALSTADGILKSLDSAEGWGTWDLLGGGLISDIAKHSHLDDAQADVERLQVELNRFHAELADVKVYADMQVQVDGFLRFADFFFDGLFADWAVLDRIKQSQEQVRSTREQISSALSRLRQMANSVRTHQDDLQSQINKLVISA